MRAKWPCCWVSKSQGPRCTLRDSMGFGERARAHWSRGRHWIPDRCRAVVRGPGDGPLWTVIVPVGNTVQSARRVVAEGLADAVAWALFEDRAVSTCAEAMIKVIDKGDASDHGAGVRHRVGMSHREARSFTAARQRNSRRDATAGRLARRSRRTVSRARLDRVHASPRTASPLSRNSMDPLSVRRGGE